MSIITLETLADKQYWTEVLAALPADKRGDVKQLYGQAMGYVWGRQDAGEGEHDTDESIAFAVAYGRHAAAYALGLIGYRKNLKDAWILWSYGDDLNTTEI